MKFTVLDGQIGYKIILFINAEIQKTDFIKSTHPAIKSNQIKSNQIKSNQIRLLGMSHTHTPKLK